MKTLFDFPKLALYNKRLMNASLPLILVADNIRSAHNVGSLFRSADGAGAKQLILTGISPYPAIPNEPRPPHVAARASRLIAKTALGAETTVPFQYQADSQTAIGSLRQRNYHIYALEQSSSSTSLFDAKPNFPAALIVGSEVAGLDQATLAAVDEVLEIPMLGQKESLNVSVAAGIALYWLSHYWLKQGLKA